MCFAPFASRSPFELWVVPRHHNADFGTATDAHSSRRRRAPPGSSASCAALGGPPYNLVLHTAPLNERWTRPTTGTGRFIRDCARSRGSSWAPDCRSTPSHRRRRPTSCSPRAERRSTAGPASGDRGDGRPRVGVRIVDRTRPTELRIGGRRQRHRSNVVAARTSGAAATSPRTLPDAGWDGDDALAFVEELYAPHHSEIYAYCGAWSATLSWPRT